MFLVDLVLSFPATPVFVYFGTAVFAMHTFLVDSVLPFCCVCGGFGSTVLPRSWWLRWCRFGYVRGSFSSDNFYCVRGGFGAVVFAMFVMTSVLCISFFYVCDDFGTVFCRVYGDFNNTTVFTAFVVTSTLSFFTISVVVWWFWFYRFDVFVVTSVVMFTVSAVVSLYEHCPRLLTFKIGIEVYSDIFLWFSSQSIFRKPHPRKNGTS